MLSTLTVNARVADGKKVNKTYGRLCSLLNVTRGTYTKERENLHYMNKSSEQSIQME